MRRDDPLPAAWGQTIVVDLAPYQPGEAWEEDVPDWSAFVVRNPAEERMHHGSRGSLPVDTIAIAVDGVIAAIGDSRHLSLDNLYAWDSEYYQYLRLREVIDAEAWAKLPWTALGPGHVLLAWDKYAWCQYVRRPGEEEPTMTFGGSWSLLDEVIHAAHFPDQPAPPPVGEATDADLLAAVRADRVDRVRALLGRGIDANAGPVVPPRSGLDLGVSHARDASLLWEAVHHASPAVTEALLEAGAAVDARPPGGLSALVGAIVNGHPEHVPVLLRHGADPSVTYGGKTAIELADARDPALARLLREARPA